MSILDGTVHEILAHLATEPLTKAEARALHAEEVAGKNRKGIKNALEEKFGEASIEEANPGLARAPVPETQEPPPGPPAPKEIAPTPPRGWRKTKWGKLDLFICNVCGRDFFDVGEVYQHVQRHHPRATTPDHL